MNVRRGASLACHKFSYLSICEIGFGSYHRPTNEYSHCFEPRTCCVCFFFFSTGRSFLRHLCAVRIRNFEVLATQSNRSKKILSEIISKIAYSKGKKKQNPVIKSAIVFRKFSSNFMFLQSPFYDRLSINRNRLFYSLTICSEFSD